MGMTAEYLKPISILLPAYNAEKYITDSIVCILKQTFYDFEFLIINDGSIDHTKEIILSYQDKRIRYIENKNNQGLIRTLNKGLFLAKGKYIARMDADDLCSENRLGKQFDYLENDNKVDILGTFLNVIDENRYIDYKATNEENKIELLWQPPVAHPSVMLKKESLVKHNLYYDKGALYVEDYKLWIDASLCGLSIKNIEEYLCGYRVHSNQVSSKYKDIQINTTNHLRIGYAKCFFDSIISGKEREYLAFILGISSNTFFANKEQVCLMYENLLKKNKQERYFSEVFFESFLQQRLIWQQK